ncbi:MAG: MurR/RpiR family transcriptional regulator [Oscillospiraceae bacterium]|nr:MurR/RpiR family transcriptional regulator [Oscillospiraceae bacterium]MBP3698943.1 MurR/RpiR family transcriptional regulator [Oscillospiraceae bacterium]
MSSVLQTIRQQMDGFSKGQKRIAEYILSDYDKAAFMTAAKLGKTAQVSESTVVRFASELGYSGYPAMQKALQELIRGRLTSVQRIRASEMEEGDLLNRAMHRDVETINATIESIDRTAFANVVEKLLAAEHVYIVGVRSSAFLAGYLNFYLRLLMDNVILVQHSAAGEIYEQMVHIGPKDVLIAISFPRYSNMVIHAVDMACERGADVIAITDNGMSPLMPYATEALFVQCEALSYVDSLAAPLSFLNALVLAVGYRRRQEVDETFSQLEQVWSKYDIFGKSEDE